MVRVIERCAGLDVHRDTVAGCIRISGTKDRPEQHIQSFGTAAADLFPATPARYAQDLWPLQARFAAAAVVDGSRLAAQRANRGRRLRPPPMQQHRFARVALDAILVEPRTGRRRKRGFCAARKHWKSSAHVRRGKEILKLS